MYESINSFSEDEILKFYEKEKDINPDRMRFC